MREGNGSGHLDGPKITSWALAACAVGFVSWALVQEREPVYMGRTLEEWAMIDQRQSVRRLEAEEAIRVMGVKRLPELVKWLKGEPTTWRRRLAAAATHWLPTGFGRDRIATWLEHDRMRRANCAVHIFLRIGPAAAPCIPELAAMTNGSSGLSLRAIWALSDIGPAAIPSLVAHFLEWPAAIERGICGMGSNAVPAIVACLHKGDVKLAVAATVVLGQIRPEPPVVIPELICALTNSDPRVRGASAHALRHFAEAARPAIPALLGGLDDPDEYARRSAECALEAIAPEELRKDGKTRTHKPPTILQEIDYSRWYEGSMRKSIKGSGRTK